MQMASRPAWAPGTAATSVAAAVVGAVALGIGLVVRHHHGPLGIEHEVFRRWIGTDLHHELHALSARPPKRWLLALAVAFGEPSVFAGTIAIGVAWCALRRWWRLAALCVIGPVGSELLTEQVGKPWFDRLHHAARSYPSGHATAAAALCAVAWFLVVARRGGSGRWRWAAALSVPPLLTGCGVVLLRWHYPTDAVGGWAVGAATVMACAVLLGATRSLAGERRSSGP